MTKEVERPSKLHYYLDIAKAIAERSTCIRRYVGAIIVKNDRIISAGYVGSPRKTPNCIEIGKCMRRDLGIPAGQFYEICRSVHAEENAMINAASSGIDIHGATLFLYSVPRDTALYDGGRAPSELYRPCYRCTKMILNSGLKQVIVFAGDEIRKLSMDDLKKMIKEDEKRLAETFKSSFKK